jgi:ribosomal protein L30E
MAHAIDVKSKIITDNSMPNGPNANRKPMTMGKYPSMGIDCNKSIKGVRISDAHLFVAANMPKETPQATEIKSVIAILEIVLIVYKGRFLISGG